MKSLRRLALALVGFLAPLAALAHPGHDGGHDLEWDFSRGFLHPFTGFDHLLAMIAVGLWAAQLGGRARWLVPAAFVAMMAGSATLARMGFVLPGIEPLIAASVLVLGLLIAATVRLPLAASMTLVGAFAVFHGLAHGSEMPATAGGLGFGAGFVTATILLHAVGLGAGLLATAKLPEKSARYAGWVIAASGVLLLAS